MKSPVRIRSRSYNRTRGLLGAAILSCICTAKMSAADGDLDPSFNPGAGTDGAIVEMALQNDGKIVIGGGFSSYADVPRLRVARVNTGGSLDTTFNPGTGASGGTVEAVALQPDGKVLIGGVFTSYNGVARNKIARANTNGSLDTTFNPGSGPDGSVFAIAVQPDGRILLGGSFRNVNGVARPGIARLDANGSVDPTFDPGSGVGLDFRQVLAIAVQPDGRIVIGGNFSSYNGVARSAVARINSDGSLDSSFDPGTGAGGGNAAGDGVRAIALRGTSIIIGGYFTSFNGVARAGLAQLNPNGSLDSGFNPGAAGDGANDNVVLAVQVLADGKLMIGGPFSSYNGAVRKGIARVNTDGSVDTSFDSSTGIGSGSVSAILVQPDGNVVIGGGFTTYNSVPRNRIARLLSAKATEPEPPAKLKRWVAGRDMAANEKADAASETSATNAAVPQWSYGYRSTINSNDFTPFPAGAHTNKDRDQEAVEGWSSDAAVILVNKEAQPVQYFAGTVPFTPFFGEQMLLKRTSTVTMPVVRWTAPEAGSYRILAKWLDMNPVDNGGAAHVVIDGIVKNGQREPLRQVFGRQQNGSFTGQEWPDEGNAMMLTRTFELAAGAVVDFVLSTRAGDGNTDDTGFNAVIVRVPTVAIAAPAGGSTFVEGQSLTVRVTVDHAFPVRSVKLLSNAQAAEAPLDTTPPYEFPLPSLRPGSYELKAVVTDDDGVEAPSETVKIEVDKRSSATADASTPAQTDTKSDARSISAATAGGRTFRCTRSGSWQDPATWGGQGVPGRNDDAVIPVGFEVALNDNVAIDNLDTAGRIVVDPSIVFPSFRVHGTMLASGFIGGVGSISFIIEKTGTLVVTGPLRFERMLLCDNNGRTIITGAGRLIGNTLRSTGALHLQATPGSNEPTVGIVGKLEIPAGLVALENYARLIGQDGGTLIGQDGASLIGQDGSTLIGQDGSTLIGQDGSTLIGQDGSTFKGPNGGSLIGQDGSTLIGQDGSTLIGQDGASLISEVGSGLLGPESSNDGAPDGSGANPIRRELAADLRDIIFDKGTISGIINLIGNVRNRGGTISPGRSPGRIRVFGDYTQESAGTLLLEVGGTQTNPLQFDQLEIGGTANLGGKLIVKTIGGFTPQPGDVFAPLTYSAVNGNFESISSNAQVNFGPEGMTMQVSGPNPPAPKALNISTRMRVETGDNVLIAGFIVTGSQPKKVLVRGIGPSLPVNGALADPVLSLDNGAVVNDDWKSAQESEIRATTIPPASDLESAIVATLQPGPHTAVLRGKDNGTGVGLVEVYDLESGTPAQLANISTRGQVQTGDDVMIGGFIISGDYPAKVLLRAIGPSLPVNGALQDPTLELVDSQGNTISNDNWRATQEREIAAILPPSADRESAIIATLTPGFYTAIVRGKDDSVGVALVEGYNLQ